MAMGLFSLDLCAQGPSNGTNNNVVVNNTQSTSYVSTQALPWTPVKVHTQTNRNGKTLEFHTIKKEEYQRFTGKLPYLYVKDLDDCRRQSGDCMETVVIRPME